MNTGIIRPNNDLINTDDTEIELRDLSSIEIKFSNLSIDTYEALKTINNKIRYWDLYKDTMTQDRKVDSTTEFIKLFENLKYKYIENIELHNNLDLTNWP